METDEEKAADKARRCSLADRIEAKAWELIERSEREQWGRGKLRDAGAQFTTLLREAECIRAGLYLPDGLRRETLTPDRPTPDAVVDPVALWQARHGVNADRDNGD